MLLSPRDQFGFFETPVVGGVSLAITPTLIVEENPDRIALIISAPLTNSCRVAPTNTVSGTTGIQLATSISPFELYQSLSGNLCQKAWFGIGVGGPAQIGFVEVLLRKWPGEEG